MQLLQLQANDESKFAEAPEIAMDFHLGRSNNNAFYLVVGCRVGILLNESTFADPQSGYLSEVWLSPGISKDDREVAFESMKFLPR